MSTNTLNLPKYEKVEQPPPPFKVPRKKFFHRFFTPCRTITLFLFVAAVLIFSYFLYFSGQSNGLNNLYIYQVAISEDAFKVSETNNVMINTTNWTSGHAKWGYVSVHPSNYCAKYYHQYDVNYDMPLTCYETSIPYVFDIFHAFPIIRICLLGEFHKYDSFSKRLSIIFLGAVIVNSIWMGLFVLTVIIRGKFLFIVNVIVSFVSLIFSLMIAVIYNKPGKELIELEKNGCFNPGIVIHEASDAFKALCCTIVVISVLYFIVFIIFIFHEIIKQKRLNSNSPTAGGLSSNAGDRINVSVAVTGGLSSNAGGSQGGNAAVTGGLSSNAGGSQGGNAAVTGGLSSNAGGSQGGNAAVTGGLSSNAGGSQGGNAAVTGGLSSNAGGSQGGNAAVTGGLSSNAGGSQGGNAAVTGGLSSNAGGSQGGNAAVTGGLSSNAGGSQGSNAAGSRRGVSAAVTGGSSSNKGRRQGNADAPSLFSSILNFAVNGIDSGGGHSGGDSGGHSGGHSGGDSGGHSGGGCGGGGC